MVITLPSLTKHQIDINKKNFQKHFINYDMHTKDMNRRNKKMKSETSEDVRLKYTPS